MCFVLTNFTIIGNPVPAAGNSIGSRAYEMTDDISSLVQNTTIFYRIRLIDIDGKTTYSNVVVIRLSKEIGISAWPNPFQSSISININSNNNSAIHLKLTDYSGKIIRTINQRISRGVTQLTINDLESLTTGIYFIEIRDENNGIKNVRKFLKIR